MTTGGRHASGVASRYRSPVTNGSAAPRARGRGLRLLTRRWSPTARESDSANCVALRFGFRVESALDREMNARITREFSAAINVRAPRLVECVYGAYSRLAVRQRSVLFPPRRQLGRARRPSSVCAFVLDEIQVVGAGHETRGRSRSHRGLVQGRTLRNRVGAFESRNMGEEASCGPPSRESLARVLPALAYGAHLSPRSLVANAPGRRAKAPRRASELANPLVSVHRARVRGVVSPADASPWLGVGARSDPKARDLIRKLHASAVRSNLQP